MSMRVFVIFLLVAFCNASNNACQSSQSVFTTTKNNGEILAPKDIISTHAVPNHIECFRKCHQQKLCVGFNFLFDAKEHEINCQITNMITDSNLTKVASEGKWTFYQSLLPTGKNCADLYKKGEKKNGVYVIDPDGQGRFRVFCDMTSSGGGWTVFQRRQDGSVNFYRGWKDYKQGFGNLTSEFWLGLDKIYRLTSAKRNKLRVDLGDWSGNKAYAEYDYFAVKNESKKYQLSRGAYSGTAGDSLRIHNGMAFSTKDSDNDKSERNCATVLKGAWWYNNCHSSNLNGHYYSTAFDGGRSVSWLSWKKNYKSLKFSEMKMKMTKNI
ncbi:fibrinogen-like protein A [Xenia sp. Carnegie-2017]|uniref:fibrinogen-like protein A n=1 Tax=Xenia sp. Carnegie-2017 TaxID=2897299 RepID=UPI001F04DAEB|nr:fibrinogen-like protein A [Xenia sp. Carnegie-2017]